MMENILSGVGYLSYECIQVSYPNSFLQNNTGECGECMTRVMSKIPLVPAIVGWCKERLSDSMI